MAKTYVPRADTPVIAIRMHQGLIVPEGDWLVIAGDKVRSLSDDLFDLVYGEVPQAVVIAAPTIEPVPQKIEPPPPPPVQVAKPAPPPPPPIPAPAPAQTVHRDQEPVKKRQKRSPALHMAPRVHRDSKLEDPLERMLAGQPGRYLYYLRRAGGAARSEQIAAAIFHAVDKNPKSLSASLSTMKDRGLVAGVRTSDHGLSFVWKVTEKGIEVANKVGVRCFTDYGLQVPPDNMSAPKSGPVENNSTKQRVLSNFQELADSLGR